MSYPGALVMYHDKALSLYKFTLLYFTLLKAFLILFISGNWGICASDPVGNVSNFSPLIKLALTSVAYLTRNNPIYRRRV